MVEILLLNSAFYGEVLLLIPFSISLLKPLLRAVL